MFDTSDDQETDNDDDKSSNPSCGGCFYCENSSDLYYTNMAKISRGKGR